ncbi:diacylglycerol O-acyltransferase 2-like [Gymnodraco acuticeps]|uniref:Acyltransferase n=1 Tax=Gymnodraco acuticeps TaxID=8218 RepID=A0A6P8T463_GYMAC|nr:diacylglycerol O-acyltransferase 2-like [Gymnodraco acuticeps]
MTKGKTKWKVFLEVVITLQWVACFLFLGVASTLLMFYLMFTSLWPIPTLYFVWQVVDWHTPERGGRKTTFVRNWRVWEHLRDFFPIKLVKTAELNPNKNYVVGIHPHGIMCAGAFTCFSTESCGFKELFPGLTSNLVTLAGVFRFPLFREYAMFTGLLPVSKKSLTHLLTNRGKGNAVVIVIGGAAESLFSAPGVNILVMRQRKGFVRVALEFGADLVPVYAFGENELFKQVVFSEGSLGRRLQELFKKIMGFAPCLFVGEHMGILPYRNPITTVVGSPISVPKHIKATEEEVDHFHKLYMEALSKLFHEHKVSCGLSESHELRII